MSKKSSSIFLPYQLFKKMWNPVLKLHWCSCCIATAIIVSKAKDACVSSVSVRQSSAIGCTGITALVAVRTWCLRALSFFLLMRICSVRKAYSVPGDNVTDLKNKAIAKHLARKQIHLAVSFSKKKGKLCTYAWCRGIWQYLINDRKIQASISTLQPEILFLELLTCLGCIDLASSVVTERVFVCGVLLGQSICCINSEKTSLNKVSCHMHWQQAITAKCFVCVQSTLCL